MKLMLLGAPGVGKGTQATRIAKLLNIPHISTGDMFREHIKNMTELGTKVKEYMNKGHLVPDEITIMIVKDRLQKADCSKGFVLDGFPRTILQAEFLDRTLSELGNQLDYVVNIYVPEEILIDRISGRRVCPKCGNIYHITNKPMKVIGKCDMCDGDVIQRSDDKADVFVERLKIYYKQTEELINYYVNQKLLVNVEGKGNINHTTNEVFKAIGYEG